MAILRSLLIRGPAKVTYNAVTFYSEDDILCPIEPTLVPLSVSAVGTVDQIWADMVLQIDVKPYGAWENLSTLFPAAFTNPSPGASLFASDLPLVIVGRNGDQITYHNARITRMADLFLGVNAPIFSSALTFTALLKDNTEPSAANAYYTIATGAAYGDDASFNTSLANYKRQAYSAAWTAKTGYSAFQGDQGVNFSWELGLTPHVNSNLGTLDFIINDCALVARAIPLQATLAQMETAGGFQGAALGKRVGAAQGQNLVFTGSGVSITMNRAILTRHGLAFGQTPLRIGEHTWRTTRTFTAGVLDPVVTIA